MALQLPAQSASADPEGPRQGPEPVALGKGGGDGSMEWCPDTRISSCRRHAVLLAVTVAVAVMSILTVGFAILQESRLQRQDMLLLEMQKRIQVLEQQIHTKSAEERGTQDHPPSGPSSEFLQSVSRLPFDQDSLAPQANQTRDAGRDPALSRSKRNSHRRGKKDKGKKEKKKQKKDKGKNKKKQRHCRRPNCDTVQRLIDCKLERLHATVHLKGLEQHEDPLFQDTFQWARPTESYFMNSFNIMSDGGPNVSGIRIHERAVYHVYSQVAMKGKIHSVDKMECGHETVVQRGPLEIPLMKSLTSQRDSRPSEALENGELYPIDTAMQAGYFVLDEGDIIKVKRPEMCRTIRYTADPQYTYFGVSKVHSFSNDDCSHAIY